MNKWTIAFAKDKATQVSLDRSNEIYILALLLFYIFELYHILDMFVYRFFSLSRMICFHIQLCESIRRGSNPNFETKSEILNFRHFLLCWNFQIKTQIYELHIVCNLKMLSLCLSFKFTRIQYFSTIHNYFRLWFSYNMNKQKTRHRYGLCYIWYFLSVCFLRNNTNFPKLIIKIIFI